jgi:hypothetical protein
MTEAEDTLLHTLGLNRRGAVSSRNYFAGEPPEMAELVAAGLMEKVSNGSPITGGDPVFRATAAGKARAREIHAQEYPKLTRSKARYLKWLSEDSEMKFGDWLKAGCYRPGYQRPRGMWEDIADAFRSAYAD